MTTMIAVPKEEETALAHRRDTLTQQTAVYRTIKDDDHRAQAVTCVQRLKDMQATVARLYDEPVSMAHTLHKNLVARRKSLEQPLIDAELRVKRAISDYELRRAQEAEAARVAAETEARRVAVERDHLQREAEARAVREAETLRTQEAARLRAAGRPKAAARTLAAPLDIVPSRVDLPAVPVYREPERAPMNGASTRTIWKFRITGTSLVPRQYLIVDEDAVGAVVRALKERTSIPGIEVYSEVSVAVSRTSTQQPARVLDSALPRRRIDR